MAKTDFSIEKISKQDAAIIILQYHYLKDIQKGFRGGYTYGLFKQGFLCGAIVFSNFPVPELAVGMLGLPRDEQDGLFELSRLCLTPPVQQEEHNLASWFVARAIALLRKETNVRVILSYADSAYHSGTVYRACNFKYYGLTSPRSDFWIKQPDGTFIKHSRGKTSGIDGEWRPRSRKHRYALVFDKSLTVLWPEQSYPVT